MKRISVPAAAAALWCILCAPAFAAERGEDTPLNLQETQEAASGGGGGLVRTIVGLAIVIGVIFGLNWVLKQVKASREDKATGDGLATLATLPLGPNRAVHVVRAGSEVLVLGATEQGIAQLRAYGEEEAIEAGLIGAGAADVEVIEAEPARPALGLRGAQALTARTARSRRPALPALTTGGAAGVLDTLRAWTVRR